MSQGHSGRTSAAGGFRTLHTSPGDRRSDDSAASTLIGKNECDRNAAERRGHRGGRSTRLRRRGPQCVPRAQMGLSDRLLAGVARQLCQPEGIRARLTADGLNRGNHAVVLAGVTATGLEAGQVTADFGFRGGVGLRPLLDRVGPRGTSRALNCPTPCWPWLGAVQRGCGTWQAHPQRRGYGRSPLADDSMDAAITVTTV
jgi:hypothetical protein